jgi:hypothetical protein
MANTFSQSKAIRDLLVEKLELYNPGLDISEGSPLWSQVIAPVYAALGKDPFDTNIYEFLKDRLKQEFPSIGAEDGDTLVDLLVTPLEMLLEPLKREIQIVRQGQSVRDVGTMRLEDARDLAANFFTEWGGGARATASVRVYFSAPTYVNIFSTTAFKTSSGQTFYPVSPVSVRPATMLLQRSGTEYYIDVQVIAASTGEAFNVEKGTITSVSGITGWTRVVNLSAAAGGEEAETSTDLLERTRTSLTERSLNVRRGIVSRLRTDFPSLVDVEAIGYGDPEMDRDILTGGGEGSVVATGVTIIVGQFVLMFSMFEQRGENGTAQIAEGDEIELNYWKFLYSTDASAANETFQISTILFDSRSAMPELPSVLLFQIDGVPSVTSPVAGSLPGVLPAVFCVVRGTGKLEISDIPGGIQRPDTSRGTIEIEDGEVHIGGHYDVWLRPGSTTESSADLTAGRSESAHLEADDLVINGESSSFRHLVHRKYEITYAVSTLNLQLGETITGSTSGAIGTIAKVTAISSGVYKYELKELNGVEFELEEVTGGSTGATGTITAIDSYAFDADGAVDTEMVLSIVSGSDAGTYRILKVEGPFLYLSTPLTTTATDQYFRIIAEVTTDLFSPKAILIPFGEADGLDLRTTIGSKVVRTGVNLQDYGVSLGDTIEIMEGDDKGTYVIQSWDSNHGGFGPVFAVQMTATNSGLEYRVYRVSAAVQRPLVRLQPGGVTMLDPSGRDSGYVIPYALPVEGVARAAFSGSKAVAAGTNGFILMDPGSSWAPTADYAADITGTDWVTASGDTFKQFYSDGDFKRIFTDAALPYNGYLAVFSIYSDGHTYLDSNLSASAKTFLQDMKAWFLSLISSFNFGGDEAQLVELFAPLKFGPHPDPASVDLLMQFEVCIPFEMFDGQNNVFVAIPEFDWDTEFEEADSFEDAMDDLNDGSMKGSPPALLQASAGDVITLLSGGNAGSYVVDAVYEYALVFADHIDSGQVDLDSAYRVAVAVIRDQFPIPAFQGLAPFFKESISWTVPAAPNLPFTVTDDSTGNTVNGWDWVEAAMTWFFQWMQSIGFDLPDSVELDVPETMKALWQLLFTGYVVSRPTADQYIRLYFMEPTSCTVYAPQASPRYQYALPTLTAASIEGETISLPLPDLEDLSVSLVVRRLSGDVSLSGALPEDASTAETLEDLAAILQEVLDADGAYITISGPSTATGSLTITQVSGGADEWLFLDASSLEEGLFWLGFFEAEPGKWAEAESGSSWEGPGVWTSPGFYEDLEWDAVGEDLVVADIELATTLVGLEIDAAANNPATTTGDIFVLGETITSSGGATGTVWAVYDDAAGLKKCAVWLANVTGSFTATETVSGGTSGGTMTIGVVAEGVPFEFGFLAGAISGSKTYGTADALFTEIADSFKEELEDILSPTGTNIGYSTSEISSSLSVEIAVVEDEDEYYLTLTIEDTVYTDVIANFTLSDTSAVPDALYQLMTDFFGGESASESTVLTGAAITLLDTLFGVKSPTVVIDDDGDTLATVAPTLSYPQAVALESSLLSYLTATPDLDSAVAFLNSEAGWSQDTTTSTRAIEWTTDGSVLILRALYGGPDITATISDFEAIDIVDEEAVGTAPTANSVVQGSSAPGDTLTGFFAHKEPTLFVGAAGAAELLFVPSASADPLAVFPGQNAEGDIETKDLPRDLHVGTSYADQNTVEFAFSDTLYEAPLEFGVQEVSDFVYVFEQRRFLEHTIEVSDTSVSKDRVAAVLTSYGSNKVRLPSLDTEEFNFLTPNSGLLGDEVQVGDILFLEEGEEAGGYTVIARSARELTLDRTVDEAAGTVYRYGNDGAIEPDADAAYFSSDTAVFTDSDVGRYLTIWASNREEVDGSYRITAVTTDGGTTTATLDTDVFLFTEQDIHWAVVKAPTEELGSSSISGRTALHGLRPIRIYSGTPSAWRIAKVSPDLAREEARIYCSFGTAEEGPKTGVKQPYKIVRPGVQHISSTAMQQQRDRGLYYFDVLSHSLGGDDLYNVPKGVRMEPVFGTFRSDGYRLETQDSRLVFSAEERTSIVLSSTFLPAGFNDEPSNRLALEGKSLRVTYDYAPVVAQVQRMMTSEADRVLCSNVLVRHFLPSYVYFEMAYSGGNTASKVASEIKDHINGLSAVEELDISKIEKILHRNVVTRYDHPVEIITLTHDLDRRIVGHRSDNRLSDDDIAYNGTNRTTFFIAGKDHSATDDADVPDGERIRLTQGSAIPTFR